MTARHMQLSSCALVRCHALFDQHRHRSHDQLANALSPRVAAAAVSVRRRRRPRRPRPSNAASASSASSLLIGPSTSQQQQQRPSNRHQYHRGIGRSLLRVAKVSLPMTALQEVRRRSSVAARTVVDSSVSATTTTFAPPDGSSPSTPTATPTATATAAAPERTNSISGHDHDHDHECGMTATAPPGAQASNRPPASRSDAGTMTMPPPPLPAEQHHAPPSQSPVARHAHSSSTSRIPNRLSLTLPIAPPTSDPSRPMPSVSSFSSASSSASASAFASAFASASASASASTSSSVPATPLDGSPAPLLSNVNDFIIAIAAKERKVMELKEDLTREETELAQLKKQFTTSEVLLKRGTVNQLEPGRSRTATCTAAEPDAPLSSRSVDLDRRASVVPLLHQPPPIPGRTRRVMRGGHTRALSLLSPAKSDLGFPALDDQQTTAADDVRSSATTYRRLSQASHPALPKRASWQPRSQHSSPVVPQIVEDFKIGLRAFVEDIRQITIGDEPAAGHYQPPPPPLHRSSPRAGRCRNGSLSQDAGLSTHADSGRGRAVQTQQPVASPESETTPPTSPPTPLSKRKDAATIDKPKPAKSKHFSWTPLGFDSLDDTDWANWESPAPVKSTRWSGSTINSVVVDDVEGISENAEELTASDPIKNKSAVEPPILSPSRLEELFPGVVNKLSPSNIKRTANNLLDEWEKSLMAPSARPVANKENTAT
ncbi:hypothetical protein E4U42_007523 [Claviceps africana]|uniref:DUF4048 domain-containing protein n=1 Tax=Claviceps africana TaxID=83212 RepID=A0A8K0J0X1_9HYPO|nr:hypothetical protein E4U42_007523 [Claviceps africana]